MKNKQGLKVETNKIAKMVTKAFMLNVFAEEPQNTQTPPTGEQTNNSSQQTETTPKAPQINYEDLITKARLEEKQKQQGKIDKLTKDNEALVEKNNTLMLKVGQQDAEITQLKNDLAKAKEGGAKIESEEITRLEKEVEKYKKQAEKTVDENSIRESIKAEYDLKLYKVEKLHEAGNAIIPELVTGSTKEEIDASIEKSKERYIEIVGGVKAQQPQTNAQQPQANIPNLPTGNVDTQNYSTGNIDTEAIRKMSAKEWAEHRKKLGIK